MNYEEHLQVKKELASRKIDFEILTEDLKEMSVGHQDYKRVWDERAKIRREILELEEELLN